MKLTRSILLIAICCLGLNLIGGQVIRGEVSTADDPHILIFSETHLPNSLVKNKTGELRIVASAFDPIRHIDINGTPFQFNENTKVVVTFPFELEEGPNDFVVTVSTDEGSQQKTFNISYEKKTKPKKRSLQIIAKADIASLDNVTSADKNEKSGTKLVGTLVPLYTMPIGTGSTIQFRGIILREKYSDDDFSANEISYTQLFVQWLKKGMPIGDVNVGLGYNDIRTNNENPAIGEDESLTEIRVVGGLKRKLMVDLTLDIQLDVALKDSKVDVASSNDEADGREVTILTGALYQFLGIRSGGYLEYTDTDAEGKYQDAATTGFKLKADYSIADFVPGLELAYKEKTRKNGNAADVKQTDKISTATIKVDYKWKVLADSQWTASWRSKKQESNVSTAEYSAAITTVGFTYLF